VASGLLDKISNWPGIDLEIPRILHGEQYIEMYEPLPAEGSIRTETRVLDIIDKGSGALIYTEITAYDKQSGAKLGIHRFTMFQFCAGNFGGPRSSSYDKKGAEIPKRPADKIISETTSEDQAAIYRLGSGDFNPLHIDPNQAQISGFNRPILHGLCTMGFATRHILKTYANNDARLFKAIKVLGYTHIREQLLFYVDFVSYCLSHSMFDLLLPLSPDRHSRHICGTKATILSSKPRLVLYS
ncbi:hypothetical protein PENTCL1PPCAC_64, partial [Pristionchus entomophagus]